MPDLGIACNCKRDPENPRSYRIELDSWHSMFGAFVGGGDYNLTGPEVCGKEFIELLTQASQLAYALGMKDGLELAKLTILEEEQTAGTILFRYLADMEDT